MSETKKVQKMKKFSDFFKWMDAGNGCPEQVREILLPLLKQDETDRELVQAVFGGEPQDGKPNAGCAWWSPDLDLVYAGYLGMAGTVAMGRIFSERLAEQFCSRFLAQTAEYDKLLYRPMVELAEALRDLGVRGVFVSGEGGMYRTLFDLWLETGYGFRVDYSAVPTNQYTIEYCEVFDQDPWELLSSGSMLLVAENGNAAVRKLAENGIPAACVGYTVKNKDKVIVHTDGEGLLNRPQPDALLNVLKEAFCEKA